MKISAIICEYNPFHKGHHYHIEQTKAKTGCDFVISIMSGSFVQRGLPAVYDKWSRTKAALACGADLVLELPAAYACASAERFAFGGVQTAVLTGIADTLSFGCETDDLTLLQELAHLFTEESPEYKNLLKDQLSRGVSFPAARAEAAEQLLPGAKNILDQSNAILGIEYLKALKKLGSGMVPCPILRKGAAETDINSSASYPSALAIRTSLSTTGRLPEGALPENAAEYFTGEHPVFLNDLSQPLFYRLRTMTPEEIAEIAEVSEGLEHKLHAAARTAEDAGSLIAAVKSKRYTQSRIQRILINCLLGITKDLQAQTDAEPYLRVLGVRKQSTALLSLLAEQAKAPVITSPMGHTQAGLLLDLKASDLRAIADKNRSAGRDFTEKFILL